MVADGAVDASGPRRPAGGAFSAAVHLDRWPEPWRACWRALDDAAPDEPRHTALFRALANHPDRDRLIEALFSVQPGAAMQFPALHDLARDLPPISWLWPGWIPRGMLTLLGAVPARCL